MRADFILIIVQKYLNLFIDHAGHNLLGPGTFQNSTFVGSVIYTYDISVLKPIFQEAKVCIGTELMVYTTHNSISKINLINIHREIKTINIIAIYLYCNKMIGPFFSKFSSVEHFIIIKASQQHRFLCLYHYVPISHCSWQILSMAFSVYTELWL